MRRILAICLTAVLCGFWCIAQAPLLHIKEARAQVISCNGNLGKLGAQLLVSNGGCPSSSSYSGPGNIVSGAKMWGSCAFGYNSSDNSPACNACLPSGGSCFDITLTNGVAVIPSGLSTCNNSSVICTVDNLYDKSGASACSGACSWGNATQSVQPTLVINALGTSPCMKFVASSSLELFNASGLSSSQAQPITVSAVIERTANFTSQRGFWGDNTGILAGNANTTNTVSGYSGSFFSATASDSAFHAAQIVYNGASSAIQVDSTYTSGLSSGSAGIASGSRLFVGNDFVGDFYDGIVCEIGAWPAAFNSTQTANMNSNQHSRYGF